MKIGIDARMIDHPGIGTYIKNILRGLLKGASGNKFVLYGDPAKLSEFSAEVKEYTASVYSHGELFFSPFGRDKLDVVHIPHFNVPFTNIKNLVITIHDLIYLKVPEARLSLFKKIAANRMILNALKRSSSVIAVSENTKNDIIEFFPFTKGKVEVIYEAGAGEFRKIQDKNRSENIKRKYDLPDNFVLSVGSLKNHKNIGRLIDAYSELKKKGVRHRLVIVGRKKGADAGILDKIQASGALYLGEIPTEDLVMVYNQADLFVFPSLYEGFGLPVLEAAGCGVPVVCSNTPSICEVAGSSVVYFDPKDTASIRNAISQVISDEKLRQGLIEKGFINLKRFSWEVAADLTCAAYRKAYSG